MGKMRSRQLSLSINVALLSVCLFPVDPTRAISGQSRIEKVWVAVVSGQTDESTQQSF
jgi:predicted membrane protein